MSAAELHPVPCEPFTFAWRLAHARAGDDALGLAVRTEPTNPIAAAALAAIAQAHYAAANVRAKAPEVREVKTDGSHTDFAREWTAEGIG